ncbi:MAG: glycosyltransferase, partial [Candidatus Moranbacteria bacterium]|nr:glycosyltransferase [Candidatus Moranbacteria bacterium]
TPMRYAWDDCQKYTQDFNFPEVIKRFIPFAMNYIRLWDRVSADRVDRFIANSDFVAKRIKKYYQKDAEVIHPPVATGNFYISESRKDPPRVDSPRFGPPRLGEAGETGVTSPRVEAGYFLMVGRLIAYKRHDIAISAFNKLGLPLKIIGRGPEMKRLQKMAGPNIEFLGRVSDNELAKYYAECRAFIFPQEEDFGIVAIEAMASGRPIIAFRGGDIPEHMEEGKMGIFFDNQTAEDIIEAVKKFRDSDYNPHYIRSKSLQFDREIFKSKIKSYLERELEKHKLSLTKR